MWRYEIKFSLPMEEELRYLDWLANTPYFYRSYPSRKVNSIYLDSINYECATTNLDGIGWRSKYRIRWYGEDIKSSEKTFEAKIKRGRLGRKHSESLGSSFETIEAGLPVLLSRSEVLKKDPNISLSIDPKLYVGYERDYFEGPNDIRMTFDRGMQFKEVRQMASFDKSSSVLDDRFVLEFKFRPKSKDIVAEIMSSLPFAATRSSKYVLGLAKVGKALYY